MCVCVCVYIHVYIYDDPQVSWPDCFINVWHCGGLSIVLELNDALELLVKRREFFPVSRFLSCKDMTLRC